MSTEKYSDSVDSLCCFLFHTFEDFMFPIVFMLLSSNFVVKLFFVRLQFMTVFGSFFQYRIGRREFRVLGKVTFIEWVFSSLFECFTFLPIIQINKDVEGRRTKRVCQWVNVYIVYSVSESTIYTFSLSSPPKHSLLKLFCCFSSFDVWEKVRLLRGDWQEWRKATAESECQY